MYVSIWVLWIYCGDNLGLRCTGVLYDSDCFFRGLISNASKCPPWRLPMLLNTIQTAIPARPTVRKAGLYLRKAIRSSCLKLQGLPTGSSFAVRRILCTSNRFGPHTGHNSHLWIAFGRQTTLLVTAYVTLECPFFPNCEPDPQAVDAHSGWGAKSSMMMEDCLEVAGVATAAREVHMINGSTGQRDGCLRSVPRYSRDWPALAANSGRGTSEVTNLWKCVLRTPLPSPRKTSHLQLDLGRVGAVRVITSITIHNYIPIGGFPPCSRTYHSLLAQ